MSDIKFDILQPAGPQTEQETELDIAMKPYLNSGQYTKKELEQIRKRLANDIEEGKRKSAVEKEKKEKEKKKQDVVDIFTKDLPGKVKPYMKNVSDVQTTGVDLIDAVLVPTQVGANILGTAVDEYSRAIGIPPRLVISDENVEVIRQQRAQQQAQQQQLLEIQQAAETAKTVSETSTEDGNILGDGIEALVG